MKTKITFILKIVSAICAAILGVIGATSLTGCNVTRASIRQPKDGSVTSITITTNNPSSVTTNANADVDVLNKPKE